jgi:hypothetical protein
MANRKTITTDPAVVARHRADSAPDNSKAYWRAWAALVSAFATTPEGLGVKIDALRSYLEGCVIDESNVDEVLLLRETIHTSVDLMSAPAQ